MSDPQSDALEPTYEEAHGVLERLAQAGSPRSGAGPARGEHGETRTAAVTLQSALPETSLPRAWSEHTLRGLLDRLPDALVVINRDGAIVLVNVQAEKMFGYRREELLGHPVEVLVPEHFRAEHVDIRKRSGYFTNPDRAPRPMGADLDLHARRRDGTEFPVEISLSRIETEHGVLVTSVIRDISRRKAAEAKFRTLVENIPAVTFIAPLDESVPEFYVSPQIEHLLGFSQREWLEDPVLWHRQLHPDDRERWNKEFAPTCAAGTPFRSVYRFVAKDGPVVWVQGSAQVVRGDDGQPLFLQGIAFDVTKVKEAEEALRQLNAELDKRVRERTEELELFAHVASHDLKEPLRTLVNYPQRLIKHHGDKFDDQATDWITRIIKGAERMRDLIDDLSRYSRVLRRDQTFTPTDAAEVCADACAALQAELDASGAELTVGNLPTIAGNQQRLMLLFQNLIGNAVKFRVPDRPARVEVGARRDEDGWLFWVQDNGIGIEARYLKRIFGLGERLHTASKYPGTGFGLAICEKVVLGHGGRIWVESEPGQGSTFYFTLPDPGGTRTGSGVSQEPSSSTPNP